MYLSIFQIISYELKQIINMYSSLKIPSVAIKINKEKLLYKTIHVNVYALLRKKTKILNNILILSGIHFLSRTILEKWEWHSDL